MTYEQMLADRVAAQEGVKAIMKTAEEAGREFTDEERGEIDRLQLRYNKLDADIRRYENMAEHEEDLSGKQPRKAEGATSEPVEDNGRPRQRAAAQTGGFNDLGTFAMAVYRSATEQRTDPKLVAVRAAAGDVMTTTDGYPIPPEFRSEIQRGLLLETGILPRTRQFTTNSNEIRMPAYEAIPGTSGALSANWTGEGASVTEQKASVGEFRLPLHKLSVLVYVTEEMLEDAPMIEGFLRTEVPRVMRYAIDRCFVRGTGAGQPIGVLNADATVTVAKESGQTADTVVFENIQKMFGRLHPAAEQNAIWLTSPSCKRHLLGLAFKIDNAAGSDFVGGHSIFLPANNVAGRPFDTLMGRPLIVSEHAGALGDKGDLILGDWQYYGAALKQAGINVATSMHIKFDEDKMAFRFTFRVGGQPLLNSAVTLPNETDTLSAFVTLAERA